MCSRDIGGVRDHLADCGRLPFGPGEEKCGALSDQRNLLGVTVTQQSLAVVAAPGRVLMTMTATDETSADAVRLLRHTAHRGDR